VDEYQDTNRVQYLLIKELSARNRNICVVGEISRHVWMGTFHSLFARILRMESQRIGYTRSFTIYDTDDTLSLIKRVMTDLGISQQQFSPQGIRSRISRAKNQMLSPDEYRETGQDPLTARTAMVYEEAQQRLKRFNAMDFDDLLLKPLELFREHADVLERYQTRFSHILVDEYPRPVSHTSWWTSTRTPTGSSIF
jgi:DNA helicase-2/ATP-dependent DNA helicase PcrA